MTKITNQIIVVLCLIINLSQSLPADIESGKNYEQSFNRSRN